MLKPLLDPKVDREAKNELIKMSNNDKQRALYEMREKANKDRTSALENAEQKGIDLGKKSVAINAIEMGLNSQTISVLTGLSLEEIEKLR